MVTITAPGVEIKEIDLSQYDFPRQDVEMQNVLVNGFASKGLTNIPYEFTNKNSVTDLINTFGKPTNEAERYFFNTCLEAIQREDVTLYAVRLPYDNTASNNYNAVTYTLGNAKAIKDSDLSVIGVSDGPEQKLSSSYYVELTATTPDRFSTDKLTKYRRSIKKPEKNSFVIVDKTQDVFRKIPVDSIHTTADDRYKIGILPVVTTAANAMYYLKLISVGKLDSDIEKFEPTQKLCITTDGTTAKIKEIEKDILAIPGGTNYLDGNNKKAQNISKIAGGFFPTINMNSDGTFDREFLKHIGIVVFKGRIDQELGNKVVYEPVEAFAGALKQDAVNSVTGASYFIDDIVNTNSNYIEVFSNCFNEPINSNATVAAKSLDTSSATDSSDKKLIKTTSKMVFGDAANATKTYDEIGILYIKGSTVTVAPSSTNNYSYALGFVEDDASAKTVDYNKICTNLDIIFEKNKDRDEKQIDIVVDAGLANIAQFNAIMSGIPTLKDSLKSYDPTFFMTKNDVDYSAAEEWKICDSGTINLPNDKYTSTWALILKKYDDFCKLRGDCMFFADGLRPLCLTGNQKNVRKNDPTTTVGNNILPFMKFITGKIDTSYGAGNCDWYQVVDPTSNVAMWMPPSVKMMCSALDTTNSKFYWTVPVGINNGKMNGKEDDIVKNMSIIPTRDIAFSPTTQDAGDIYTKSWNYASYYQDAGFVLEGQRTFQSKPTAFDRINVRRLFLYLERKVYKAAKYFVYEGNTAYTRQRLVDAITPFFEDAKINEGLYDYRIQCDDKNNTPDTIDHNELHVKIAIKPTKAIEFIECTFVALRTGASFTEAGMND